MSIKINQLTHIYMPRSPFETKALDNVSVTIEDGEYVSIVGHTGSGKSTLVQHLNGLLMASSGSIQIDDLTIGENKKDLKAIRRKVGMVFQYPEHQLFEETVFKDVAFGPKNLGIDPSEIAARVTEALEIVELDVDAVKDRSPFELSGGQRRRVAIAGVLAMRPKVLVLDEPTAGLDPHSRNTLLTQIKRLNEQGMTIILISHSMEETARNAKRILVMNKGKLEMDGKPEVIFSNGDALKALGLALPAVTELMFQLKQKGLNVPNYLFNSGKAAEAIAYAWRLQKGGLND
jgi:energy-coupling factor transport system ATP-binding protein